MLLVSTITTKIMHNLNNKITIVIVYLKNIYYLLSEICTTVCKSLVLFFDRLGSKYFK